ncbi:MAG TPA: PTS lactose/cellobiose transporter subunit IIA [Chloroflexi bacterium]|nr:PTS lactose/cellobiose transporter subunit IIA [Chloroflexota bacterium]
MAQQDDIQSLSWEQRLFTVILHAGNARSKAIHAAEQAEVGEFEAAEASLEEAEAEQLEAHKVLAFIIQMEAKGEEVPFSVLLTHSMDLLLLAWAEIDHSRQLMRLYRRVAALEREVEQWRK